MSEWSTKTLKVYKNQKFCAQLAVKITLVLAHLSA